MSNQLPQPNAPSGVEPFRLQFPQEVAEWEVPADLSGEFSPPEWIDPAWRGYSNGGPVVNVPQDPFGYGYTTMAAKPGDTVRWVPQSVKGPHYVIIEGVMDLEAGRKAASDLELVAIASGASFEDRIRGGITPLGEVTEAEKAMLRTRNTINGYSGITRLLDPENPQEVPPHPSA